MSATLPASLYRAGSAGELVRPCPQMSQVITVRPALRAARLPCHMAADAP